MTIATASVSSSAAMPPMPQPHLPQGCGDRVESAVSAASTGSNANAAHTANIAHTLNAADALTLAHARVEAPEALLAGLDEQQRAAAASLQGAVRIIAGAGAGKTRTITRRIAYACATGSWNPDTTLAVTFSVKAAAQLRARLQQLGTPVDTLSAANWRDAAENAAAMGDEAAVLPANGVQAATFHSAALRQLRMVWHDLSDAPFPRIASDAMDIMRKAVQQTGVSANRELSLLDIQLLLAEINWCKVSLIAPEAYAQTVQALHREVPIGLSAEQFVECYRAYEREKTSRSCIDFHDILLMLCHVLDANEAPARRVRASIATLTVDEYQDVSPLQHRLLRLWLSDRPNAHRQDANICVVGDPAQTIYSFAGAYSYYLTHFEQDFQVAADIALAVDYRSTPQVVACANRVLARSPERGDYLKLSAFRASGARVLKTAYETDLAEAHGVARRLKALAAQGIAYGDCAILTRVNAQQRLIMSVLREEGVPYQVRREALWQADEAAAGSAGDAASSAMRDNALRDNALRASVTLSTIHASKGLEFPCVFVVGCSEGLLPYHSPQAGEALEEERRLMYVAVTRAEDRLCCSYAKYKDEARGIPRQPSRFLA